MTDALEHLTEIHGLAGKLNPSAVRSKVAEWTRGGLPSQSFSEGRGTSEPPLPGMDSFDRLLRREVKAFEKGILDALLGMRFAHQRQLWILEPSDPKLRGITIPDPFPCSNLACTDELEEGLQSGECSKCRKHRSRHGLSWPQKQDGAA